MAHANQMGLNKTGIQMSPNQAEAMVEGTGLFDVGPIRYDGLEKIRRSYIAESEPVGAVPLPGTLRGALSTGKEKLKGHNPEILINKLGERLAFERAGVRLYDAMILKCEAAADDGSGGVISLELLRKFRNEEAEHFFMVRHAMESLGADPTAQTPDADVMGVVAGAPAMPVHHRAGVEALVKISEKLIRCLPAKTKYLNIHRVNLRIVFIKRLDIAYDIHAIVWALTNKWRLYMASIVCLLLGSVVQFK